MYIYVLPVRSSTILSVSFQMSTIIPLDSNAATIKFCKFIDVMRSKYQIHKTIACPYLFYNLRLLHHAATKPDHHIRILFFLAVQISEAAIDFVIGIFTHGTGIIDHKIRIFGLCLLHIRSVLRFQLIFRNPSHSSDSQRY